MLKAPAKHILIAEDDPIQSDLADFTLVEAGYVVTTAADGVTALDKIAAVRFDLILVDINLPGADGFTIVRTCRAGGPNSATPVVVVTGQSDSNTTLQAYRHGAAAFLAKPIDWVKFPATIASVLKGAEISAEQAEANARAAYWIDRAIP